MEKKVNYYTPARKRASEKYRKEKMEQISFWVKKGEKDVVKEAAKAHGMSMKRFIAQAINDKAGKQLVSWQEDEEEPVDSFVE